MFKILKLATRRLHLERGLWLLLHAQSKQSHMYIKRTSVPFFSAQRFASYSALPRSFALAAASSAACDRGRLTQPVGSLPPQRLERSLRRTLTISPRTSFFPFSSLSLSFSSSLGSSLSNKDMPASQQPQPQSLANPASAPGPGADQEPASAPPDDSSSLDPAAFEPYPYAENEQGDDPYEVDPWHGGSKGRRAVAPHGPVKRRPIGAA